MKGLIVKKKWLDKIFDEGKIYEMRSRNTNIRGVIKLIESGSGMVVGEANLIHSSFLPPYMRKSTIKYHKVKDLELLDKWSYAWILRGAKRYDIPKPYKHPQGAVVWVDLDKQLTRTK